MDAVKRFYLDAMDVPVLVPRKVAPPAPASAAIATHCVAPTGEPPMPERSDVGATQRVAMAETPAPERSDVGATQRVAIDVSTAGWEELERQVKACIACPLSETRTNTVFGVGDRNARWLVVGEAPGADEDAQGEPFVGRAGRLLNSMLEAAGAPRERVFIANTLKCRPPANRDPQPAELAACRHFLDRQVELVKPELILTVGRIATQALLDTDTPIGKLRGTVHRYRGIPLVATYHPAYLLRSPGQKRRAWEDLKLAVGVAPPLA